MILKSQYDQEGYLVLKRAIAPERLQPLKDRLASLDLIKRKANLMDDSTLLNGVDALVRPLFLEWNLRVDKLVELHVLLAPNARPVKLAWHKDRPPEQGTHSFQMPLLPGDTFHQLVPGTHTRELNSEEISARNAGGSAMPNAIEIALEVGNVLLRSPFILYRGLNEKGLDRMTLVGTYTEAA